MKILKSLTNLTQSFTGLRRAYLVKEVLEYQFFFLTANESKLVVSTGVSAMRRVVLCSPVNLRQCFLTVRTFVKNCLKG